MTGTATPPGSTISSAATPAGSPAVKPMHDPSRTAVVVNQQLPLGVSNRNLIVPGQSDPSMPSALGQKALLAKKFASASASTISPTDQMQSPCTAKLSGAKQRRFAKGKPVGLARFSALHDENTAPEKA